MRRSVSRGVLGFVLLVGGCIVEADTPSRFYETCFDSTDCSALAEGCYPITFMDISQPTCTSQCASDADCPPSGGFTGACYRLAEGDPYYCYQRCEYDYDCYVGYACFDTTGPAGPDRICLPY